jgi:hypothetical protein
VLLLLIASLGLLWLVLSAYRARLGFDSLSIRGTFVLAFLAFEVLLLLITELSSAGHHFTAGTVEVAWSIVVVVLLFLTRSQIALFVQRARTYRRGQLKLRDHARRWSAEDLIWLAVISLIFVVLVITAFLYRPSYGDSMVYHLVRVEHWIQDRSVTPFATHYLAQVEFSPLSEYNLAHLHLLAGTDRFDNCMELFSAVVCIIGVSELARLLGASRSTQITASVLCATIPTGILLSANTDNDFFAAATGIGLLIITTTFSIRSKWVYSAMAFGATVGLIFMAKSTMTAIIGPAVVALLALAVYRQVRTGDLREALQNGMAQVLIIGGSALAIVGVFLAQTDQLFGTFVGPTTKSLISSPLTISGFGANVDRATAANFQIGDGVAGIQTYVSKIVLGALRHVYSIFGVSFTNQHYTYGTEQNVNPFLLGDWRVYQRAPEYGANPWNILLAVAAALVLLFAVARGRRHLRVPLLWALTLGCGFILFTGIDKWAPYNVRYQLPFFVAVSVPIAVALSLFPRRLTTLVLAGLVVSCLPQLLDNTETPLVPPLHFHGSYLTSYFGGSSNPPGSQEAPAYQTVTTMLAQSTCTQAALGNWVYIEYPLWVGLQHEHYKGVLNDFNVDNATSKLVPSYRPCASITQRGTSYTSPNDGMVNVQQSNMVLSIQPRYATTIRVDPPRFESSVPGVSVLPGGGWSTDAYGDVPFLRNTGSLYLFTTAAQPVQLRLQEVPKVPQSTLTLTQSNGHDIRTTVRHDTIAVELHLHRGINQIGLATAANASAHRRLLILSGISIKPAGS